MSPVKALSLTAALFALHALVTPSCVQWNIGGNIREAAETHVGINPMDVWYVGEKVEAQDGVERWMQGAAAGRTEVAREARYEADTPLVHYNGPLYRARPTAQHIHMTEHFREVGFRYGKFSGMEACVGKRVPTEGQKMERVNLGGMESWHYELDARSMGCAEVERSVWYPLAVVAAAPFDYLVDPALSILSTPVAGAVVGVRQLGLCLADWWREASPAAATDASPPAP